MSLLNKELIKGGLAFKVYDTYGAPVRVSIHGLDIGFFKERYFVGEGSGFFPPWLVTFRCVDAIEAYFFNASGRIHDGDGIPVVHTNNFTRKKVATKEGKKDKPTEVEPSFYCPYFGDTSFGRAFFLASHEFIAPVMRSLIAIIVYLR